MQPAPPAPRPAVLSVINPSGNRSRVDVSPLPYLIGRNAGNHLVIRDNRISRGHARIIAEGSGYAIEDLQSRHGTFVNGERIAHRELHNGDHIEFGFPDSYKLTFAFEEDQLNRILDQIQAPVETTPAPGSLGKLRSLVEVARALQNSLSTNDILTAVVDAALAITAAERGFLLLKQADNLEVRIARDHRGAPLPAGELRVPTAIIQRALHQRRELLSMSFDPVEEHGLRPETTVANLELRSVVCVPLVKVRSARTDETSMLSAAADTVGLLYMDTRAGHADLSHGNRELLQTLALEASTILENARLLDEERVKQRLEEELDIARQIQADLLPDSLPSAGWFRAAGSSIPSHQVGGDYFDVRLITPGVWSTVVADVSGKGVSSALLASLLQGAFLLGSDSPEQIADAMIRINRYLLERTRGEKYATVFFATISESGLFQWSNAGHCAPLLVHPDGRLRTLQTTGLPLGMLEIATYGVESVWLQPGDKVVIYSDGVTEAENAEGQFFSIERLRALVRANVASGCDELHDAIIAAVDDHAEGALVSDDITLVVLEIHA